MDTLLPHIEAALNALGIAPARECAARTKAVAHSMATETRRYGTAVLREGMMTITTEELQKMLAEATPGRGHPIETRAILTLCPTFAVAQSVKRKAYQVS